MTHLLFSVQVTSFFVLFTRFSHINFHFINLFLIKCHYKIMYSFRVDLHSVVFILNIYVFVLFNFIKYICITETSADVYTYVLCNKRRTGQRNLMQNFGHKSCIFMPISNIVSFFSGGKIYVNV